VRTNLRFLRALIAHDAFVRGRIDTELVARDFEHLVPDGHDATPPALAIAAAAVVEAARSADDPWTAQGPWRLGEGRATTVVLHDGAAEHAVRVRGRGPYEVGEHTVARGDGESHLWVVDGQRAAVALDRSRIWVECEGRAFELDSGPPARMIELTRGAEVAAPMPGVVIATRTAPDQRVRRGDLLFVVEAMKMELRVEAPADGVVKRVLASVGQQVERGQRLADFEAEPV